MNLLAQIAVAVAQAAIQQVAQLLARKQAHKFVKDVCTKCGCDLGDPLDTRWSKPCAGG